MQFKIQFNHLRDLRKRKWHFSSGHDKFPKTSGQSLCSQLINSPPESVKAEGLSWAYCLPQSLASYTCQLQAHATVLSTASFISIQLLLLKGQGCRSWETEKTAALSYVHWGYHAATLLAWDKVVRSPKENFGPEIAEEHWVGSLLENFCHL